MSHWYWGHLLPNQHLSIFKGVLNQSSETLPKSWRLTKAYQLNCCNKHNICLCAWKLTVLGLNLNLSRVWIWIKNSDNITCIRSLVTTCNSFTYPVSLRNLKRMYWWPVPVLRYNMVLTDRNHHAVQQIIYTVSDHPCLGSRPIYHARRCSCLWLYNLICNLLHRSLKICNWWQVMR